MPGGTSVHPSSDNSAFGGHGDSSDLRQVRDTFVSTKRSREEEEEEEGTVMIQVHRICWFLPDVSGRYGPCSSLTLLIITRSESEVSLRHIPLSSRSGNGNSSVISSASTFETFRAIEAEVSVFRPRNYEIRP